MSPTTSRTPSTASALRGTASPSSTAGVRAEPGSATTGSGLRGPGHAGSGADAVAVLLARPAAGRALAVVGLLDAAIVLGHGLLRSMKDWATKGWALRVGDSTDRRAQAKAAKLALLALLLGTGAMHAQDAGKDDDVLGWLSGTPPAQAAPQAPAPAPTPTPPPAQ